MPLHVLGHANDTLSHAGDWLGSAAALPAPAAAQGALWGGAPFVRPGTSLYTSGSTEISSVAPALESRCTSAHMFSVAHCRFPLDSSMIGEAGRYLARSSGTSSKAA